jgi:hypothetical protein
MRKPFFIVAVALFVSCLSAAASPTSAAGPYDGAYLATLSNPTFGTLNQAATVIQNADSFLLITLLFDGTWTYGFGTVAGNIAQGNLFTAAGVNSGSFYVTIVGDQITGQSVINGQPFTFAATKAF